MSSVPKVPPETMKKVAATRGHKVSRTNCCFWDFAGGGVSCGFQAGELVAVANFDVVLPSDSLSPPRPLPPRLLVTAIPGIREVGSRIREYSHLDVVEKNFWEIFRGRARPQVTVRGTALRKYKPLAIEANHQSALTVSASRFPRPDLF